MPPSHPEVEPVPPASPVTFGPNVIGQAGSDNTNAFLKHGSASDSSYSSGALKQNLVTARNWGAGSVNTYESAYIAFNAHDSNSIYTDSGKVYPASVALNFIIKT